MGSACRLVYNVEASDWPFTIDGFRVQEHERAIIFHGVKSEKVCQQFIHIKKPTTYNTNIQIILYLCVSGDYVITKISSYVALAFRGLEKFLIRLYLIYL